MGASQSGESITESNPEPTPITEPTMEPTMSEKPYEHHDESMDWFWPVI